MKTVRLSFSAVQKYDTCPAMYKYHYVDKIRPSKVGSPLFFGSAIDEALNRMLLDKKLDHLPDEIEMMKYSPEEIFTKEFKSIRYNGKEVSLTDHTIVEYSKGDVDLDILNDEDILHIKEYDKDVKDHLIFMEECFAILKNKESLSDEDLRLYIFIANKCLYRKGLMLIQTYRENIYPEIHTVFNIQKKVLLEDESTGDTVIGFIDAVVSFNDAPEEKVVLDNKTSSMAYKADSVALSPQLSTYAESEETSKGAYAVLEKKLRKREPRTRSQLIVDTIPEETFEETFQAYDNAIKGIRAEKFDKNYKSGCFFFQKPCPYLKYCKSNGKLKEGLDFLKEIK